MVGFVEKWKERRRRRERLRRPTSTIILFLLLYKGIFSLAVVPIGRTLWTQALLHSRTQFISNSNLKEVLLSPLIWLTLIVIAVGYMFWNLMEISAVLICLECAYHNKKIGLIALLRRAAMSIRHIYKPKNLPLLMFAAVIVPFTNTFLTSDMISQIVVPAYIMEVIQEKPVYLALYSAVFTALVFWVVEWMFVFHYFVLEQCDLPEAAGRSIRLIRGRRIGSVVKLFLNNLWHILLMFLYLFLTLMLIVIILIGLGGAEGEWSRAFGLILQYALMPILVFAANCVVNFAQYAYLTLLFHRYKNRDGEACPECAPEAVPKKRITGHGLIVAAMYALMVAFGAGAPLMISYAEEEEGLAEALENDRMEITSHRGYSAVAPENTIPAFQAAIDCGVTGYAELDVQQTKDGVVVLTHDTNLKRCTGVNVNVTDITYEELKKLDASLGYSGKDREKFAGTPVPTLDEVIKFCKGKIKLNIEIKGTTPTLVDETVRVIRENGFEGECIISSLQYDALERVKELAPELKCGYIMAMGAGLYYDLPAADFFSIETMFITPTMISELHTRGKEVHAWTVDTEDDVKKMRRLGVDNVITGRPEETARILDEEEATFSMEVS